jgi:NADPH2:quinone reductase
MKAKAWCWTEKGEPGDLVLKEIELPELEDDELLIENKFAGLNPVDWKLIKGGHIEWKENHIPGVDASGIIAAKGKNVQTPIGTRICYHTDLSKPGSFSTHTIIKDHTFLVVPETVSDAAAAAFPCPGLTALQAYQKTPSLENKKVLVNGAGGSVGFILTQLLINSGAEVYVTASPKHHAEFYKLGVVKAIDYQNETWKEELSENLFSAIFDMTSAKNTPSLFDLIAYNGHVICIQGRIDINPLLGFTKCVSLHEIALAAFHKFSTQDQTLQLMKDGEGLLDLVGSGKINLRPIITADFEQLNIFLQEMKDKGTSEKRVVKL